MTPRTLTLPENTLGRDFVVADIHGAYDLLDEALEAVNFDPKKDRLIVAGDLIDRGSQSAKCLEYLAQPWFYSVRGNHESMFMYLFQDGILNREAVMRQRPENGVAWLLDVDVAVLEKMREAFVKLPIAMELQTPAGLIGFVHGEVPIGMDWDTFKESLGKNDAETKQSAVWGRLRIKTGDETVVGGLYRLFSGHTPVEGGPVVLGNCFFIDTGAVFKLMDKDNQQDLFLTLAEIKANAEDICNPVATKDALVRIATTKPPAPPTF